MFKCLNRADLRFLLPVFTLSLILGGHADSQVHELKLGHAGGAGSIQDAAASEFAVRVNKEIASSSAVRVYGDSELGNDSELLRKLSSGDVTLGIVAGPMSSVGPEFGIFDMPFLVRGRAHFKRFRDVLTNRYLQPAALRKGYRVLAVWEFGVRHITNNIRPIKIPSDLNGLKFRVPKADWRIRMFKSYGVQVTPMEIQDIHPGLASGQLDGLEMPLPVLCSLDIHKLQKYLSLTSHLYSPAFLIVDEAQYQKQPIKVREAISSHAQAIQDWVLERGEELDASWLGQVRTTMAVNEADRISFTLQALPIYKEFVSRVPNGKSMIKLVFDSDPEPFGDLRSD